MIESKLEFTADKHSNILIAILEGELSKGSISFDTYASVYLVVEINYALKAIRNKHEPKKFLKHLKSYISFIQSFFPKKLTLSKSKGKALLSEVSQFYNSYEKEITKQ